MRKAKLSDFKNPPPKILEHQAAKSLPESLRHAAETGVQVWRAQRKKTGFMATSQAEDVAFEEERIIFEEKD